MHQRYDEALKVNARKLRQSMTKEEVILWSHLRRKQILGVKFLRQKPMYGYILDFYCADIKLAIEIDGSQHYEASYTQQDKYRDTNLSKHGICVVRYSNAEINYSINEVLEDIHNRVRAKIQ